MSITVRLAHARPQEKMLANGRAALPDAEPIIPRTLAARLQAAMYEIAVGTRASWDKRCSQRRPATVLPFRTSGGALKNRRSIRRCRNGWRPSSPRSKPRQARVCRHL